MDISFEQLLVGLLMLVPGFISTNILRSFTPLRFNSELDQIIQSLLVSMCLNAALIIAYVVLGSIEFSMTAETVKAELKQLTLRDVTIYFGFLFAGAFVWGILTGLIPLMDLRRPATWITVTVEDGRTLFGHLRHSSEHINKSEPFEVYLVDVYQKLESGEYRSIDGDGVYLRLNPRQAAQLHFHPIGWSPNNQIQPTQ